MDRSTPDRRLLGRSLAASSLIAIGLVTLWPIENGGGAPPWCIACNPERDIPNLALNVVLFAPLGLGLALCGLSRAASLMLALAATVTVEALQFRVVDGRDASAGDILANVLGAAIGFKMGQSGLPWAGLPGRPQPEACAEPSGDSGSGLADRAATARSGLGQEGTPRGTRPRGQNA